MSPCSTAGLPGCCWILSDACKPHIGIFCVLSLCIRVEHHRVRVVTGHVAIRVQMVATS